MIKKALFLFFISATLVKADCNNEHVHLLGDWGQAQFDVEIADTPAERAQGLMHRQNLPRFSGMLFIFEKDHIAQFWMKNTLIPLDIMYFDRHGTLLNIWENAQPGVLSGPRSDGMARYVLEIPGGMSSVLNIRPGTRLVHPNLVSSQKTFDCE